MIWIKTILILLLSGILFLLGLITAHRKTDLYYFLRTAKYDQYVDMEKKRHYTNIKGRTLTACPQNDTTLFLTLGQSNSANAYPLPQRIESDTIMNHFDDKCYIAKSPLLGADGDKGSIWPVLVQKLQDKKKINTAVIKSIGSGGVTVCKWAHNKFLTKMLDDSLQELERSKLAIDYIFWHQGETDQLLGTSYQKYKSCLQTIINKIRKHTLAPIFIATASRCDQHISTQVRNAQIDITKDNKNVFRGPDTDLINDRTIDDCHFNEAGAYQHINQWLKVLDKHLEKNEEQI